MAVFVLFLLALWLKVFGGRGKGASMCLLSSMISTAAQQIGRSAVLLGLEG